MFNTDDITVLFAAAGCGKTTYLKKMVRKALKTVSPSDIAFVSFTRKGAEVGRSQIVKSSGLKEEDFPFFKTLNSLTFAALGYSSKDIFGFPHAKKLNAIIGSNITMNPVTDGSSADDKILAYYSAVRSGYADRIPIYELPDPVAYERLVRAYEAYKAKYGLVDFVDCLLNFVARGEPIPVQEAHLDEAQDFTALHWKVCSVAFARAKKIVVAGDDFQSIYTYAGARPDILIDLAKKNKTVKLEKSYRLPNKVYRYSKAITDMISEKMDKDYAPIKGIEGTVEHVHDVLRLADLVEQKQNERWLILFRNNYQIQPFEEALRTRLVPYHTANTFVVPERELEKIHRYMKFRLPGYSTPEQRKIFMDEYGIQDFNTPFSDSELVRGDAKHLYQAYVDRYGAEFLLSEARKTQEEAKITLSTIHKVKGAEAKNVVVFLDCSTKVYGNRFTDLDSELRLMYVAFTRSEENLYLSRLATGYGLDDIVAMIEEQLNEH